GRAHGVAIGRRAGGVVQQLHLPALVVGLAHGGVVAVVDHVADHAEGVDPALFQVVGQVGAGEAAGHRLLDEVVARALRHLRVQLGGLAAAGEDRRAFGRQVLDHDDRDAGRAGGVHGAADV